VGGRVDANVEDDTLDEVEETDIPELEFDELDRDEDVEDDLSGDVDGNEYVDDPYLDNGCRGCADMNGFLGTRIGVVGAVGGSTCEALVGLLITLDGLVSSSR
jgi:hypothetical protein